MTSEDWEKQFKNSLDGKKAIESLKELNLSAEMLAVLTNEVLHACFVAKIYSVDTDINKKAFEYYKDRLKHKNELINAIHTILTLLNDHPVGAEKIFGGKHKEIAGLFSAAMPSINDKFDEIIKPGTYIGHTQGPLWYYHKQSQSHQPDAQTNGLLFHLAYLFKMFTSNTVETWHIPKPMPPGGKPCHKQINLFILATLGKNIDTKTRLKNLMKHQPELIGWEVADSDYSNIFRN